MIAICAYIIVGIGLFVTIVSRFVRRREKLKDVQKDTKYAGDFLQRYHTGKYRRELDGEVLLEYIIGCDKKKEMWRRISHMLSDRQNFKANFEELIHFSCSTAVSFGDIVYAYYFWQFRKLADEIPMGNLKEYDIKSFYQKTVNLASSGKKYKTISQIAGQIEGARRLAGTEVEKEMSKFLQEHISVSSNKVESKAVCQLFNALTGLNMYDKPPHVFVKKYLPEHFPTLAFTSYSAIIAMNSASKSKKDSADVQLLMSRIQNAVERQVESPENG